MSFRRTPTARRDRRTPAGLIIPTPPARVRGRTKWRVYDGDGRTPALADVLDRHGRHAGRAHESAWTPNLITNAGMDDIANQKKAGLFGTTWRDTLHVGEGSTAPANSDTALDSEVESGNASAGSDSDALDTGNDVFRSTGEVTASITMSADRNLTEYGFSPDGVVMNIRELFRDAQGDPITISLLSGKIITVTHELTVELAAPVAGFSGSVDIDEYDAADQLVGTTSYSVTYGWSDQPRHVMNAWVPNYSAVQTWGVDNSYAYDRTTGHPTVGSSGADAEPQTYVGGSHEREKRVVIATSNLVGTLGGVSFGFGFGGGLIVLFDSPDTFVKANTHTLEVGYKSTWARA